ncbi:MAG: DUF2177 family protein [Lewinellaceae bacterium]|nr:DUF2177 family protein [Saprospiraceae bacterium]MCB0543075.1 DUF2177 family protein [Saprospiraceae bacterium]MCB9307962.1 DUF2177 family protein [Lewinellaceae bacterium]MCB9355654.1 DUF2177 family protein [Lewinellaceae bacterium]
MNFLLQLTITGLALFLMDAVWLEFVAGDMIEWPAVYHFGNPPNWYFAQFYYVLTASWITLIAHAALLVRNAAPALTRGMQLGFWVSVFYASVNQVFFTPWRLEFIILDILWNTIVFGGIATLSAYCGHWLEINFPEQNR